MDFLAARSGGERVLRSPLRLAFRQGSTLRRTAPPAHAHRPCRLLRRARREQDRPQSESPSGPSDRAAESQSPETSLPPRPKHRQSSVNGSVLLFSPSIGGGVGKDAAASLAEIMEAKKTMYHEQLTDLAVTGPQSHKEQIIDAILVVDINDPPCAIAAGALLFVLATDDIVTIAEMVWDQAKFKLKRQLGTRSELSHPFPSQSLDDIIPFLKRQTSDGVDDQVCLLIHSIDGPALRDVESQQWLAQVSCCPQVHVVASTVHPSESIIVPPWPRPNSIS